MHFYWFSWTKIISINIKLCFFLQFFQFLQDLLLLFTYQSSYAHQTKKNFHFSNNFHTKNKLLINWYSKCTFLSIFFLQFVCIASEDCWYKIIILTCKMNGKTIQCIHSITIRYTFQVLFIINKSTHCFAIRTYLKS